jgi:plastocyanin
VRGLAAPLLLAAVLALLPAACDTDNDPLLGAGGGGGSNGDPDSLVALFDVLSGQQQTGSTLEVFRQPLRVLALDRRGFAVPGIVVRWELQRGVATLSSTVDTTGPLGQSEVLVTAGAVLGPIEVDAYVAGSNEFDAAFDLLVSAHQVQILADRFVGPLGGDTLYVVAGDTVEWLNRDVQSHLLRSVDEPSGGVVIRSDTLRNSDRYRFVPNLPGTWVYEDRINSGVQAPRGFIRAAGRQEVGALEVEVVVAAGNAPVRNVLVTIDGGVQASSILAGERVLFPNLSAVPHLVRLREVPLNCVVAGDNPRTVTVLKADTVSTRFELGCE